MMNVVALLVISTEISLDQIVRQYNLFHFSRNTLGGVIIASVLWLGAHSSRSKAFLVYFEGSFYSNER